MARIAFVLGEGFEDSEFRKPYDSLAQAGHQIDVLGIEVGAKLRGKKGKEEITIEHAAAEADPARYDALVIPGGHSPDHLRLDPTVITFVDAMVKAGKLIAAICHGPQLLADVDAVRGKTVTSWPSVRTKLRAAGAHWVDQEVAIDGRLITSRKPDDLPAFTAAIKQRLG